jgi:hypothetical protein
LKIEVWYPREIKEAISKQKREAAVDMEQKEEKKTANEK